MQTYSRAFRRDNPPSTGLRPSSPQRGEGATRAEQSRETRAELTSSLPDRSAFARREHALSDRPRKATYFFISHTSLTWHPRPLPPRPGSAYQLKSNWPVRVHARGMSNSSGVMARGLTRSGWTSVASPAAKRTLTWNISPVYTTRSLYDALGSSPA